MTYKLESQQHHLKATDADTTIYMPRHQQRLVRGWPQAERSGLQGQKKTNMAGARYIYCNAGGSRLFTSEWNLDYYEWA